MSERSRTHQPWTRLADDREGYAAIFRRRGLRFRLMGEAFGLAVIFGLAMAAVVVPLLPNAERFSGDVLSVWIWSGALLLPLLFMRAKIDAWFTAHQGAGAFVIGAVCAAAVWVALGENLEAKLGPIDDHDIVEDMGPGHSHSKWKDWPAAVAKSEAGSLGTGGRFRPLFFAMHLAQCCVWGKSAFGWYLAHMIMCFVMLAFLWQAAQPYWGASLSFAFTLFVLGLSGVGDFYGRLMASEAYAMPFFAIGLWAWSRAFAMGPSAWGWWWAGAGGFVAAELCKENFVPLTGLAAVLAAVVLWRAPASRKLGAWGALVVLTMVTLVMVVIVVRMVMATGRDFYGNEVHVSNLLHGLMRSGGRLMLTLAPLAGWFFFWIRRSGRDLSQPKQKLWRKATLFFGILAAAWFSQAVFYRNVDWPDGCRYDFPGVLVPFVLLITTSLVLLQRLGGGRWRNVGVALLLLLLLASAGNGLAHHTMVQIAQNAARTRKFSSWLSKIVKIAEAEPDAPMILLPGNAEQHFEPVISVFRYLRYKKVTNPIFYSMKFIDAEVNTSLMEKNTTLSMKECLAKGIAPGLKEIDDQAWPADGLIVPFGERQTSELKQEKYHVISATFDSTRQCGPLSP